MQIPRAGSRLLVSRVNRIPRQGGAVLLTALILLLILTLIGTGGMKTVTMEERMVSNMQNANKAFHGAEAGLADCETSLLDGTANIFDYGTFGANDWWEDETFWNAQGQASGLTALVKTAANPDGLSAAPRCVVEFIGDGNSAIDLSTFYSGTSLGSRPVYRVTAFSNGSDATTQAVVESMFVCGSGCSKTVNAAVGGP